MSSGAVYLANMPPEDGRFILLDASSPRKIPRRAAKERTGDLEVTRSDGISDNPEA
jgi:hypothetical protein